MKNGSPTTIQLKKSWIKKGERRKQSQNMDWRGRRCCVCVCVCVCVWDWKGIVHYELLSSNQTINSELYCELQRLQQAIERKWPELINRRGVIFHHDNARPYTSVMTRQKLRQLGWEVLMHPPYSPDIAPSDYHLCRSLQNSLNGVKFQKRSVKITWSSFSIRNHRNSIAMKLWLCPKNGKIL